MTYLQKKIILNSNRGSKRSDKNKRAIRVGLKVNIKKLLKRNIIRRKKRLDSMNPIENLEHDLLPMLNKYIYRCRIRYDMYTTIQ